MWGGHHFAVAFSGVDGQVSQLRGYLRMPWRMDEMILLPSSSALGCVQRE